MLKSKSFLLGIALLITSFISSIGMSQGIHLFPDGTGGYWGIDGNRAKRFDGNGKILAFYSNSMLGSPLSIDPSDPFKILLFYSESQSLALINTDGVIIGKPVNIPNMGLGEVIIACRSARGGVWMLHPQSLEVVRTDRAISRVEHRFNLSPSLFDSQPNFMVEQSGTLYIGLNNKAIALFEVYGAPFKTLDINYENVFIIEDDYIWTTHEGIARKISLSNPTDNHEFYSCPCQSLPIVIKEKVLCFDGIKFRNCEKIQE